MTKNKKPSNYSPEYIGYRCNIRGMRLMSCDSQIAMNSADMKNPKEFVIINVDIKRKVFIIQNRSNANCFWFVKREMIEGLE